MQHMLHAFAGLVAGIDIANVAFNECKAAPGFRPDDITHHVQILLVTGQKVVQPHNGLAHLQKVLKQIGTDKTRHACNQPAGRGGLHRGTQLGIRAHVCVLFCNDLFPKGVRLGACP